MSLVLCLSSVGLHRDLMIDPVSVDLRKILHHVSAPVDFIDDWRGAVVVPKLLVGLSFFANMYQRDTLALDEMRHDFHHHPEYTRHHLLFSTPGDPMNILSVDEIKSLLSRAILKGIADDLPAQLTLNVRFRGSSGRKLLDLLCRIVPRLPDSTSHPFSPSSVGDTASSALDLRELGSAILSALNQMSVTPAVISPTSPSGPSPSLVSPTDVSTRSAFLSYRGLDPATSRSSKWHDHARHVLSVPSGSLGQLARPSFTSFHAGQSCAHTEQPCHPRPFFFPSHWMGQ
jgi:hypothetical protein